MKFKPDCVECSEMVKRDKETLDQLQSKIKQLEEIAELAWDTGTSSLTYDIIIIGVD